MSSKEPGYVYILTNPSFREDWVKNETYSSQGFNEIVNHYGMQQYQSKSDQRELPDKKSVFMPIELAQIANDVMPSICG